MNKKVTKFGGSSLATAKNILKAQAIVKSDSLRRFIVVSAPGKLPSNANCKNITVKNQDLENTKVTDLLIDAYTEMCSGKQQENTSLSSLNKVITRFEKLATELDIDIESELERTIDEIDINRCNRDFVVSRGEYLTAVLFAKLLNYRFVDASKLIILNKNGRVNETKTQAKFEKFYNQIDHTQGIVIGGFYGRGPDYKIKLMERGGGDYSGAIAATSINAKSYEVFTDTNGVQTANPAIVANTQTISHIDFSTLHKLAKGGASVIFPDCLPLLRRNNIPLVIDNTFNPHTNFTTVTQKKQHGIFSQSYFSITYTVQANVNKSTADILCIFNKIKFPYEILKDLLKDFDVYITSFKVGEFKLITNTKYSDLVIKKLHEYFAQFLSK